MNEFEARPDRVVTISKKKFWVIIVVLIIILVAGGFFWYSNFARRGYYIEDSISLPSMGSGGSGGVSAPASMSEKSVTGEFYPDYYYGDPDITDTREFLKTNYSAQIDTRNVSEIVEGVEDAVKVANGRVDNRSSSEKFGYVSFVIPKSELDDFKEDIKGLTSEKLIFESISSQNLLSQKQDIERRTDDVIKTLEELEQEKIELDKAHASRIGSINTQIAELERQEDIIRVAIVALGEDDPDRVEELNLERSDLLQRIAVLKGEQTRENREYSEENNYLIAIINDAGGDLTRLADEDTDFMNNIETVQGRVNVRWINLWTMGNRFSPSPMWLNTAVLVILVIWFLRRRRVIPRIQVV